MSYQQKPILEIRDLTLYRQGKRVLEVDSLSVYEGEKLAVIGPNGAGKSTLLLTLARILKPSSGVVMYRGETLTSADDLRYRRKIALVLQDPLLLDGSVSRNVATGLRLRGVPRKQAESRVDHWLGKLGIAHLKDRPSRQLSGGEAQRVSLARAMAIQPELLLLDEPFGALDPPTRSRLLEDFQALLTDMTLTMVFVTHDMDEALALGDRIAVIVDSQLRQVDTPERVFSRPADVDVASLVGVETVLVGKVLQAQRGQLLVDISGIHMEAVGEVAAGRDVLLLLRPEDITLWLDGELPPSSARNRLAGTVSRMTPQGPLVKVTVSCQGADMGGEAVKVVSLVTRRSAQEMGLVPGRQVLLTMKASSIHIIAR